MPPSRLLLETWQKFVFEKSIPHIYFTNLYLLYFACSTFNIFYYDVSEIYKFLSHNLLFSFIPCFITVVIFGNPCRTFGFIFQKSLRHPTDESVGPDHENADELPPVFTYQYQSCWRRYINLFLHNSRSAFVLGCR